MAISFPRVEFGPSMATRAKPLLIFVPLIIGCIWMAVTPGAMAAARGRGIISVFVALPVFSAIVLWVVFEMVRRPPTWELDERGMWFRRRFGRSVIPWRMVERLRVRTAGHESFVEVLVGPMDTASLHLETTQAPRLARSGEWIWTTRCRLDADPLSVAQEIEMRCNAVGVSIKIERGVVSGSPDSNALRQAA